MKTLYDLLGARADDDAEGLRNAFRKAAKANHPDLHAGDPDAPIRFRQIVEAYDILRDAEQRAVYDRLLKFERERLRRRLKSTASYLVRSIVSDAVAVVGLAIVLGGGYTLFAYVSKTPIETAKLAEVTARGPTQTAARTDTTHDGVERRAAPETPFVLSAVASDANDGAAPAVTTGGPILSPTGPNTDDAKPGNALDIPIRQADAKSIADQPDRTYGMRPFDRDKGQTADLRFSSPERNDGAPKLFSSHFAVSDDKPDVKTPDAANVSTGHARIPEMKPPARARTAAKRQATSRTAFAQAAPENRSTCSGSCSGDSPPLFGVGF
jgi:curved DNA-binding protein CbpA